MKLTATMALGALVLAGCGGDQVEQPKRALAPRSCAKPEFGSITNGTTMAAARGTKVGVAFVRGRGLYAVDETFVEVLHPGADLESGGDLAIWEHRNPVALSVKDGGFDAADRTVAVTFDGVDAEKRPLPPGQYPVVFAVRTHGVGTCKGDAGVSTILTTLDWRG